MQDQSQQPPHIPVLLPEVLAACNPQPGQTCVDATFGAGGYSNAFLDAGAYVIGLDRDATAIEAGRAAIDNDRLTLIQTRFGDMATHIKTPVDMIVMDIGVSSMQLDQAERGFSFQQDAPLDMRMDTSSGPNAATLVNTFDEETLADIFYHYGDERASRRIAKAIVAHRPIDTTLQLADIVKRSLPPPRKKHNARHPATQVFQALRIAVNNELGELFEGLCAAERCLKPDGVLAVVTFHSLEDRIVKRFLQVRSTGMLPTQDQGAQSRYAHPIEATPQHAVTFDPVHKRPVAPSQAEQRANPRARSAKLRAARRTQTPATDDINAKDLDIAALTLSYSLNGEESC